MPKVASTASHVLTPALLAALLLTCLILVGPADGKPSEPTNAPQGKPLRTANALVKLEPRALRLFPESFGGLWLGDGGKVFIAFVERGKQRVERLGERFPKPNRLRAVAVDDSLAALRAIQAQMNADRQVNPVTATEPSSGRQIRISYDLDIDIMRNVVVAIVERTVTPDLIAAFQNRYGADVVVEEGLLARPESLLVCQDRLSCPPNLRAGLQTIGSTNCSTAFTVRYPSAGGKKVAGVLSAAHCGDPDLNHLGDQSHAGVMYGEVVAQQQSGRVDAELHSVGGPITADTFWSGLAPWIYVSDASKRGLVTKVGTYDGLPVNYSNCKAGYVTGTTCGKVETKWYVPGDYVLNGMDFVKTTTCSNPGDSGGGVFHLIKRGVKNKTPSQYEALGVHSGGPKDPRTMESLLCGNPNDYSVFGHIEFVQDAFAGLTVNTGSP